MRISLRLQLAIALLGLLGMFALMSRWFGSSPFAVNGAASNLEIDVTSSADRGPGSLREALYRAAGAAGSARIVVRVTRISLQSPLPPLVNVHGISIVVAALGAEIDGRALDNAPVLDIDAEHASIVGLAIDNCPGPAVLLRAGSFHMRSVTIRSCDVAVDVAAGVADVSLEHNSFANNRVGVRFAAASPNSIIAGNTFSGDVSAGVWAVRGQPDGHDGAAIVVRDNHFSGDRIGVVMGNIAMRLDGNELRSVREAAVYLTGEGASVLGNRISGSASMGIVADSAVGATISSNEIDRAAAYGVIVKASADSLLQGNRVHNCGYGMAFVLGDAARPNTAVDNSLLAARYNGVDVIGDSPILRRNRVLQAGVMPLRVDDYRPRTGRAVYSRPFLEGNEWGRGGIGTPVTAAVQ